MSLPSIATFYKNDKVVKKAFINCGWFCLPDNVKHALKYTLSCINDEFDWDLVEAYGMIFSKTEIINYNK